MPNHVPSHQDQETEVVDSNQTNFTWEEPIFEAVHQPIDPNATSISVATPWFKKPIIILALAVVGLLITLIAVASLFRPSPAPLVEASPSPSPVQVTVSDPLRQEIEALQVELQEADPSKLDLPFPPVNFELQIMLPR